MSQFIDPDSVTDRESFERFVEALIADRKQADEAERADPERYRWGGANGWQNSSITMFLECALAGSQAQDDWATCRAPTWHHLAVFLFLGKIYE